MMNPNEQFHSKATVAVALSAYNGERYIAQQIESLLYQTWPHLEVFVRDDGSTDSTLSILRAYEAEGLIHVIEGENVGVTNSFFQCIAAIPDCVDYIALCDQDDYWHKEKVERAVYQLQQLDQSLPLLYCSNFIQCDENLKPLAKSDLNKKGVSFERMLFESVCYGNTMLFNRKLATCALKHGAYDVVSHDWWLGLIATAFGILLFDEAAYIDYRRLETSVSALGKSPFEMLIFRAKQFLFGDGMKRINAQNKKLLVFYADDLDEEKRDLLLLFCGNSRWGKIFSQVGLRQKTLDEIALRILFALGH